MDTLLSRPAPGARLIGIRRSGLLWELPNGDEVHVMIGSDSALEQLRMSHAYTSERLRSSNLKGTDSVELAGGTKSRGTRASVTYRLPDGDVTYPVPVTIVNRRSTTTPPGPATMDSDARRTRLSANPKPGTDLFHDGTDEDSRPYTDKLDDLSESDGEQAKLAEVIAALREFGARIPDEVRTVADLIIALKAQRSPDDEDEDLDEDLDELDAAGIAHADATARMSHSAPTGHLVPGIRSYAGRLAGVDRTRSARARRAAAFVTTVRGRGVTAE